MADVTDGGETAELAARVAALESRLAAVDAERGVLWTLHRLAQTIDYGDHDAWLDCFAPDGVFQMVEVSGGAKTTRVRHEGRAALAGFIPGHTSAPEYFHKHLTTVPLIQTDGPGEASAVSYFVRVDNGAGGPFLWSFGRYLDRFTQGEDGHWRLRERILEVESRARPVRSADIGADR